MNTVFDTCEAAARGAAELIAHCLSKLIEAHGRAVLLIDCTSRPLDLLTELAAQAGVDWTQVIVFQASEFVGETADSKSSCQWFLTEHLISRVPIVTFHPMRGDAPNPPAAVANLTNRYLKTPADVAFLSTELYGATGSQERSRDLIDHARVDGRQVVAFSWSSLEEDCSIFVLGDVREELSDKDVGNTHFFTYGRK